MTHIEPLIRGERVFLRHPTADDEREFVAIRTASRELHRPWEPISPDGVDPCSPAAFHGFLASANTPDTQKHLICHLRDGAIVGYVGLSQIFMRVFCSCYMGYWIGAAYQRKGLATEGVSLCVERAFTQLGLHRVEANIIPGNAPSIALIEKCGFRKEGYSPRYLKIAGAWQDHERWALTIEDWRADRAQAD